MTEYEKLLDKMHFEIGTTLMDNRMCRTGAGGTTLPEGEILRSTKRTYMNLKAMMMRLERELFGERPNVDEEDETEISDRNTSAGENTKAARKTIHSPRVGDFSC